MAGSARQRVLFIDHGQFGFRTHGEGLAHFADRAPFATVHRSEQLTSSLTPGAVVGDRAAGAKMPIALARIKDSGPADRIRRRREGARLRSALDAVGGDVTHVHAFPLLAAHPPTLRKRGITWSLGMDATAHQRLRDFAPADLTPAGRASRERLIAHERVICAGAEFIAATSRYCARGLIDEYGVPPNRIEIIPHCIKPVTPRRPTQLGDHVVDRVDGPLLFVGDNLAMKGFPRLLGWHQSNLAERVELAVVSRDPRPADLHTLRNVRWLGRVDNERLRAEVMAFSRALVLPTTQDMSPMVLLEAAAAGLPAVATNLAGIPELIDHGRTGFVLDADDERAWPDALARLSDDDDLVTEMSSASTAHFADRLDGAVVAEALFAAIAARLTT